jgi:hypothetical protein
MPRDNAQPGTAINELELARQVGVATTGIGELLNRFQRFGLIERRPNAGWMFKGFTPAFALDQRVPSSSPNWDEMQIPSCCTSTRPWPKKSGV